MPPRNTHAYGIDTSIFVRLLTGHPTRPYEATVAALQALFDREPATELFVSNQVIGETYITLQYHYRLSKADARNGILEFLEQGFVSPLNGEAALAVLRAHQGAGLIDRLIAQDYHAAELQVLTNDHKMSKLPGVQLL